MPLSQLGMLLSCLVVSWVAVATAKVNAQFVMILLDVHNLLPFLTLGRLHPEAQFES